MPIVEERLGPRATRGLAWMTAKTMGMKATSLIGQVVLAWLLLEDDFGVYALALTVFGVASLIHQGGVREVLVHRQASFDRWATAGFWLSLVLGSGSALVMIGLTPVAVAVYDEPRLESLLWILAASIPLQSLGVVPHALLQKELRFRALAVTGFGAHLLETASSVLLAFLGFGALSFILPKPAIALFSTLVLWILARPSLQRGFAFRRWRYLINHSLLSLSAAFLAMTIAQGDYALLGFLFPAQLVGIYFLAYRLSSQTLAVFNSNLAQVLLPALTRYRSDPERQVQGFLSGIRPLAFITVPVCLLQAALADPVITVLFEERWSDAIPLVQILSIGMAFNAVGGNPGSTLLKAQGRFSTLVLVLGVKTGVFVAAVGTGASFFGVTGAAFGVLFFMISTGVLAFTVAVSLGGGTSATFWRIVMPPIILGGIAVGSAAVLSRAFSSSLASALTILIFSTAVYVAGAYVLMPDRWEECRFRLKQAFQ